MKNRLFLVIALVFAAFASFAQEKGTVRGLITDGKTGEELAFVKVIPEGFTQFARDSDFDGTFNLRLPAGNYTLVFREADHNDFKQTVTVIANKVVEVNVKMLPIAIVGGEAVEIIATVRTTNSIGGGMAKKAASEGSIEVFTKEQIEKTPANSAADIVQQIPAVSVVNGKEVYVRGLGDRYTKTILNSMEIPGLDPDRNTVQMDIFPSSVIDNITVFKTFTPNLPGDFTGGVVNIETRDFQTKKTMQVKAGLGYNTAATFNSDYLLYKGGKLDFLGFDDGTRALPISSTAKIPDPTQNDTRTTLLTTKFGKTMAATNQTAFMNQNYGFVMGNQFQYDSLPDFSYGYNIVANYRNNYSFVEEVEFNEYRKDPETDRNDLFIDRASRGSLGEQEVTWSILAGQSIRFKKKHKLSLTAFHTQNATSQAAILNEEYFEFNPAVLYKHSLQYSQRSVSNLNLAGKSVLDKWTIDWKLAPTLSLIDEPDIRSTALEVQQDENGNDIYLLEESVGAEIRRSFRDLREYNLSGRLDLERRIFVWKDSLASKIKFGGLVTHKNRNFNVYDYTFKVENPDGFTNDPNFYFQNENIWNEKDDQGTYGVGSRELANTYQASQNIFAGYVMQNLPITKRLEAIYGARVEQATNYYTGVTSDLTRKYNNEEVLNEFNVLPSLNIKYVLKDSLRNKMNLRFAASQTVARPSFKEKSIAQIYDPIQGRTYNGNIDLLQTNIINLDTRWEWFFGNTETVSASAFYKRFENPIEISTFEKAPTNIQAVNAGVADLYGIELEVRKQIAFFDTSYANQSLFLGVNGTYAKSRLDMEQVEIDGITERESRESYARDGETIGRYRAMAGQSPFIVNAYLNFVDQQKGWDANISYNIQGKRLSVVGVAGIPDVYENPFNSLNLKVSKSFGKENAWKASFSARNLLKAKRVRVYESFGVESQIYDSFYRGMSFSASVTYNIFGN